MPESKYKRNDYAIMVQEEHHADYYEYVYATCYLMKRMRDGNTPPFRFYKRHGFTVFTPSYEGNVWRAVYHAWAMVKINRLTNQSVSPFESVMWDDSDTPVSFGKVKNVFELGTHFAQYLTSQKYNIEIRDIAFVNTYDNMHFWVNGRFPVHEIVLAEPPELKPFRNQVHKDVMTGEEKRIRYALENLHARISSIEREMKKPNLTSERQDTLRINLSDARYRCAELKDRLYRLAHKDDINEDDLWI